VVGDEEVKGRQVNVRYRDDTSAQDRGKPIALDEAVEKIRKLRDERGSYNPFPSIVKPSAAKDEAEAK
jgi:threonyl-tRNA synthetase